VAHAVAEATQKHGAKSIIGVAFSPSGDLMASTDTAGDAYVWSTKWLGA